MVAIQKRDGPAGPEDIVIRMRRENQNRFIVEVFEASLLRLS
jgi:hypothetical protein